MRRIDKLELPADRVATRRLDRRAAAGRHRRAADAAGEHAHRRRHDRCSATASRARSIRRSSILCDISGSMSHVYARLPAFHARARPSSAGGCNASCSARGSPTSPARSAASDPDEALAACSESRGRLVGRDADRHGAPSFNREWSRRVLGQGAIVLLVTDGLERDGDEDLGARNGPPAPFLPPAHLAQSAARLRGRSRRRRRASAPCCRMSTSSGRSIRSRRWATFARALGRESRTTADPRALAEGGVGRQGLGAGGRVVIFSRKDRSDGGRPEGGQTWIPRPQR